MIILKKIIVSLITLLLLPIVAFADVGAPSFTEYSVRVSNKNGTTVKEWENGKYVDKHIEYDTILKNIVYEEEIDGELYGHSDLGIFKLSDCEPLNKDIDLNKYSKDTGKLYVYKKGAYLYNGPSKIYGKVDNDVMIPVGETITYTYKDELFAYVDYKGTKGWVYTYQVVDGNPGPYKEGSSLATLENGKIHTVNDATIYINPYKGESTNVVIPKNTDIEYKYVYDYNVFKPSYYVTYKNTSGWIFNTDKETVLAKSFNSGLIYTYEDSLKLCKKAMYDCDTYGDVIPKNTLIPIKYIVGGYDDLLYVENDEYSGWIETLHEELSYRLSYSKSVILLENDVEEYSEINGTKTDKVLKNGKVSVYDFYILDNENESVRWFYVPDNKTWIKVSENSFKFLEEIDDSGIIEDNTETEKKDDIKTTMPINELIIYILIGAVILSLCVFVIIKLVNKKQEEINKSKE